MRCLIVVRLVCRSGFHGKYPKPKSLLPPEEHFCFFLQTFNVLFATVVWFGYVVRVFIHLFLLLTLIINKTVFVVIFIFTLIISSSCCLGWTNKTELNVVWMKDFGPGLPLYFPLTPCDHPRQCKYGLKRNILLSCVVTTSIFKIFRER